MPSARVRSRPSAKLPTMSASTAGEASAPPTPCAARAASSQPAPVARPPASDETVNRVIPARNTRRRPRMSPARPPSSSRPPKVSVYAFSTQDRPAGEKRRPAWMCGSAMFTTVRSRTIMSWANSMMTSATPGWPRRRAAARRPRSAPPGGPGDAGPVVVALVVAGPVTGPGEAGRLVAGPVDDAGTDDSRAVGGAVQLRAGLRALAARSGRWRPARAPRWMRSRWHRLIRRAVGTARRVPRPAMEPYSGAASRSEVVSGTIRRPTPINIRRYSPFSNRLKWTR